MIIDCHYHLQEKLLTVDELLERMDISGVDRIALMANQIDPFPEPPRALVAFLQFMLTRPSLRGIGKLFISNFTQDGIKILGKNMPLTRDPDNDAIFKLVDRRPDRFLGWVFVNPNGGADPVSAFEQYKDHKGCVGVKAHPFWNHHTLLDLVPVAKRLAETNRPLLIHAGYGPEGDYEALLKEVPDLKLILAHAGFPLYADTWKAIQGRTNVFVDLSQTSYVGEKTLKAVVDRLGADQCLFGTDGPFGFHDKAGKFDYGLIKRRIEQLIPNPSDREKVLGGNFSRLAGL